MRPFGDLPGDDPERDARRAADEDRQRAEERRETAAALEAAGIVTSVADGAVFTDADLPTVGRTAFAAGIALTELRSADGAGLEEMFLELTAESQRDHLEGAAA